MNVKTKTSLLIPTGMMYFLTAGSIVGMGLALMEPIAAVGAMGIMMLALIWTMVTSSELTTTIIDQMTEEEMEEILKEMRQELEDMIGGDDE